MARLEAVARASTHGGYDATMTSDPYLVSKVVFDWWWIEQGNGAAYRRRVDPCLRPPSCFMVCDAEARSAARTLRVDVADPGPEQPLVLSAAIQVCRCPAPPWSGFFGPPPDRQLVNLLVVRTRSFAMKRQPTGKARRDAAFQSLRQREGSREEKWKGELRIAIGAC